MAEQKAQESWNMATETLKRLSRCLDMCSYYSQIGDLPSWFNATLDLRKNLSPFLEPDEYTIIVDKIKTIPKNWKNHEGRVNRRYYGQVYNILDSIYIICIRYMKEKGLLMPKTTDPRSAVLNN